MNGLESLSEIYTFFT